MKNTILINTKLDGVTAEALFLEADKIYGTAFSKAKIGNSVILVKE
jgi:hypothetical protein